MSDIVAKVNGTEIKRSDLENAIQGYAIEQLRKTADQLSDQALTELRELAMEKLQHLRGCEVHMTHIPTPGDEAGLRRLGVNLTSDPNFSTKDLFIA